MNTLAVPTVICYAVWLLKCASSERLSAVASCPVSPSLRLSVRRCSELAPLLGSAGRAPSGGSAAGIHRPPCTRYRHRQAAIT